MRRLVALALVVAGCKGGAKPPADPVVPSEPASPAKPQAKIPGLELPAVTPNGFDPVVHGPMIVVSPTGILVDDEGTANAVLEVRNGDVDAAEKEGGALGLKIPRLTAYLANDARLAEQARQARGVTLLESPVVAIAVDRTTPSHLFDEVLFSAKQAEVGYKRFQILGQAGDKLVAAPLRLPDHAPAAVAPGERKPGDCDAPIVFAGPADQPPADAPIKPVVSITKDKVFLWSISALEGTVKDPKVEVPLDDKAPAAITAALAEIVKRRWPDGKRPECSGQIVVMPDSTIPMSVVVPMLGAVRASPDGTELFADVLLSMGFE